MTSQGKEQEEEAFRQRSLRPTVCRQGRGLTPPVSIHLQVRLQQQQSIPTKVKNSVAQRVRSSGATCLVPPIISTFIHAGLAIWLVAGLLDWGCHRQSRIKATSGVAECAFHWVLLAQGCLALMMALAFRPTASLLALLGLLWLAHEFTTWIELRIVVPHREIGPTEQMVHSLLEVIPLALLALLALETFATEPYVCSLELRRRDDWPSAAVLGAYIAAGSTLVLAPFTEEAWRCLRYGKAQPLAPRR